MSNRAIHRTTRNMKATLLARRNLSIGDISVVEVSDSSKVRPNPVPIGPSVLDLKYVSVSANEVVDSQQVNHECDQEIDRKPYPDKETRINVNRESEYQIDPNPHARLISSLQTNLKEAQVIQTIALQETITLKAELITWIEKWDVLRGKKLKFKESIKRILLKNQRSKR